jgi:hypothetical protein
MTSPKDILSELVIQDLTKKPVQHMADGKSVKAFAEKLAHAVSVPFTHFSNSPTLSVLDPAKYGSGIKGAEAARLKFAPEIAPRSYVYSGVKAKPEAGLGPHKYHGVAENVYPLHTDPEGFRAKAQKMNELYPGSFDQQEALNDMERLIKRAGYSGYVNEGGTYPAAVLFQPHSVIPAESLAGHPNIHHAVASKNAETMLGLRPGNTAEERAAAMGYDARQFHGTNQGEIEAFDPSVKLFSNPAGTFTSPEASFANKYAFERAAHYNPETGMVEKDPGANVMPLMTKSGTAFDPLSPEGQRVLAEYADEMGRSERHKNQMLGGGWEHMEDPDLIDKLKNMGYTGMHVMEDDVKNLATFEPKDLRSVNAAFDPAKAESSDLLHADGGLIKKSIDLLKKLGMSEADRAAWQAANKTSLRQTQDPLVAQAAKDLGNKVITGDQYRAIVRKQLPIKPYTEVPPMPTPHEMAGALHSNKLETGIVGQNLDIPHGTRVASRLDIPAYNEYDKWIVSLHDAGKGNAIGYGQSAHLMGDDKPIEFITSPMGAHKIAANEMNKESFARIRGNWQQHDPQELYQRAQTLMADPEWTQIGMNPYRHSYFYDKADMAPVTSADEVIQIGPLVLGKGVKKTSPDDPMFRIKKSDPESPTFKKGGNIKVMKYEVLLNKAKK